MKSKLYIINESGRSRGVTCVGSICVGPLTEHEYTREYCPKKWLLLTGDSVYPIDYERHWEIPKHLYTELDNKLIELLYGIGG